MPRLARLMAVERIRALTLSDEIETANKRCNVSVWTRANWMRISRKGLGASSRNNKRRYRALAGAGPPPQTCA